MILPLIDKNSKVYITCCPHHTFLETFKSNGIQIFSPLVIVINDDKSVHMVTLDTILGSVVTETSCIGFHNPIAWNDIDISSIKTNDIVRDLQILNRNCPLTLKHIINICSHYATRYPSPLIGRDIFRIFNLLGLGVQLIEKTFQIFCAISPSKPKIIVVQHIKDCESLLPPTRQTPQLIILNINHNEINHNNLGTLNTLSHLKKQCIKANILILSTKLGHEQLSTITNNITKEDLFLLTIKNQPSIIWDIIRKIFLYNKHIINKQI